MDAEPSGLRRCNEAEPGQCLDPARRIALDAHLFVVGGAVPAMFAPLEHEKDGAQYLVPRGNDGTLVASAYDPGLQPGLEHATGASGGMGKLCTADGASRGFLCACGRFFACPPMVVVRTHAHP